MLGVSMSGSQLAGNNRDHPCGDDGSSSDDPQGLGA